MHQLHFDDLVREYAQSGSVLQFAAAAALVRHGDAETDIEEGLQTAAMASSTKRLSFAADPRTPLGTIYPLGKREGSPFEHIGIGRAPNVDVQVLLLGISKYHAYVERLPSGGFSIADAGSQNGTRIGFRRLEPREPAPLESGTRLFLAHYLFTFVTREGLVALVRAQAQDLSHGS